MVKAAKAIIFRRSENFPVREKRRRFSPSPLLKPHPTHFSSDYDWHNILKRDCAQEIKRCKKLGLPERVRTNAQAVLKEINQCNKPRQASFLKNLLVLGLGAQGLGPGPPGAWGPGPATQPCHQFFVVLKSLPVAGRRRGGRRLKRPPYLPPFPRFL